MRHSLHLTIVFPLLIPSSYALTEFSTVVDADRVISGMRALSGDISQEKAGTSPGLLKS
jgi:hypothetical protein